MGDETSSARDPLGRRGAGPAVNPTPLEALGMLASQDVRVTRRLRHIEVFTLQGLLTLLWHAPDDGEDVLPVAVVVCGGAMGGLLGPAEGLYHHLGVHLAGRGVPVLRVSYRRPNDLDQCSLDVAAAVQLAATAGAERVVLMGHSFGGAVVVRVAVMLPTRVAGVVTFATQSAGCDVAGGLGGRPFLLFHGNRDELVPVEASEIVKEIAGFGEVVVIPNEGHLLAKSGPVIWEHLRAWLPATLGLDLAL